ncbi:MAG TPA: lipid-binding SYLF domain-containing protein [Candidatus Acidoferrales bacterium]|nr:lipid-binding SYLF domain-containing protein [Candidatus Acidoferrales bacterium]
MRRFSTALLCLAIAALPLLASDKDKIGDRLEDCGTVMKEILGMPDSIPKDMLNSAVCVMVIPAVKKGAFIFGASYGRGAITCRGGDEYNGAWSAPSMFRLIGGNVGFQIGGQETDYVLLVMNDGGVRAILRGKVKLGADASVAIGPVGRTADAQTNGTMRAEVLAYSRARGVFAGISLEGANLQEDQDANTTLYGRQYSAVDIVRRGKVQPTEEGQRLLSILTKITPKHSSN